MSFRLDWQSGPSAQIEIIAPPQSGSFMLKYASPYRATIRPPMESLDLTSDALTPINSDCARLEKLLGMGGRWSLGDAAEQRDTPEDAAEALKAATDIGYALHTLCFTNDVRADLRTEPLHIELGLEECLLDKPWELLFSDGEFLSLKHNLARFVNSAAPLRATTMQRRGAATGKFNPLRILLVSVPQPQPRGGRTFDRELRHAVAETKAIRELLEPYQGNEVHLVPLEGRKATRQNFIDALTREQFHIIHFNGHANFNAADPYKSALVLDNEDVATSFIRGFITKSAPVLCFINACESAATGAGLFGLARAFLDTGAYLIGSRWRISDNAAAVFARQFYESLLLHEQPLGRAVTVARQVCKKETAEADLGWASYVYYGDPRVAFRRVPD